MAPENPHRLPEIPQRQCASMRPEPNGSGKRGVIRSLDGSLIISFNEAGAEWLRKTLGHLRPFRTNVVASMRPEPNGSGKPYI